VSASETVQVSWAFRITLAVLLVIAMAEVWVLWMASEVVHTIAGMLRWLADLLTRLNGR
jgi:hypothetical protein